MKIKLYNIPFLFLFLVSCSSIDEGAIVGTWEINPDKCELSIDNKIFDFLPQEIADQYGYTSLLLPMMFKSAMKQLAMKIEFKEDGTWERLDEARLDEKISELFEFKWSIDNERLILLCPEPNLNEQIDQINHQFKSNAFDNLLVEIVFDINKLSDSKLSITLDLYAFLLLYHERGYIDQFNIKKEDFKSIAKNIKLTLAFKKV